MPLRTESGARATPAQVYGDLLRQASALKRACQDIRSAAQGGAVTNTEILQRLYDPLVSFLGLLDRAEAIPGMAGYARSQSGDPRYDLQAEIVQLRIDLGRLKEWIEGQIPRDPATGALHLYRFRPEGSALEPILLTSGHAELITLTEAVISRIE